MYVDGSICSAERDTEREGLRRSWESPAGKFREMVGKCLWNFWDVPGNFPRNVEHVSRISGKFLGYFVEISSLVFLRSLG